MQLGQKRPAKKLSKNSKKSIRQAQAFSEKEKTTLVEVLRLSDDGRGVASSARHKTVLIDGALVGERLEIEIQHEHAHYDEAKIKKIYQTHPERSVPACSHFGICGGCQLQHMPIEMQRQFKVQSLIKRFERQGLYLEKLRVIKGEAWRYRRRARLQVDCDKHSINCGFYRRQSHQVISLKQCPILLPCLENLVQPIQACLQKMQHPHRIQYIELLALTNGIIVRLKQHNMSLQDAKHWEQFAQIQNVTIYSNIERALKHRHFYTLQLKSQMLAIGVAPNDFIQNNSAMNQKMLSMICEWLNQDPQKTDLFDLFSGAGNFSLPLALAGWQLTAVEASQALLARLQESAKLLGISQRIKMFRQNLNQKFDLSAARYVILDPPREGAYVICEQLAKLSLNAIIYISCNPATLVRDTRLLVKAGYKITQSVLIDMFPQTAHSEVMLLFERNGQQ